MKIAYFTDVYEPTVNGVVNSINQFVHELLAMGHEVRIVCPEYPDHHDVQPNVYRVRSMEFKAYAEYRIASPISRQVDKMMHEWQPDIVHVHSPFMVGALGKWYATRLKIPVLYTAHTDYAEYLHYAPRLVGKVLSNLSVDKLAAQYTNRMDCTIAPSEKVTRKLEEYGARQPVMTLPTGIVPRAFRQGNGAAFRKHWGIAGRAEVLLYVGRLSKEKNLEFLLQAFCHIRAARPRAMLLLVGDGPLRDELTEQCHSYGIADAVIMTGYLRGKALASAYAAATLFAFTSTSETQGMTPLEAAYSGLPLAVLADINFAYIAEEGVNAIVSRDDAEDYAEDVISLLGDRRRLQAYGKQSRRKARQFTMRRQAKKLESLYVQLVEGDYEELQSAPYRKFTQRKVSVLGADTVYVEARALDDTSPTLICLHGFLSDNRSVLPMLTAMEHQGRIIVPDIPGFGLSPIFKMADHLKIQDMSDWFEVFLASVIGEDERIVVVGYSFGAYVAIMHAASNTPLRVNGYVLVTPVISIQKPADIYTRNFLNLARVSQKLAENAWRFQHDFTTLYLSKSYNIRTKVQLLRYRRQELGFFQPPIVRSLFEDVRQVDLLPCASAISRPISIITADNDNLASKKAVEVFAEAMHQDVAMYSIENAGHLVVLERPQTVATKLRQILYARPYSENDG